MMDQYHQHVVHGGSFQYEMSTVDLNHGGIFIAYLVCTRLFLTQE